MKLTYTQRRAMSFVIKQQIDVAINNARRITNEFLLKDSAERRRRARELALNERRN